MGNCCRRSHHRDTPLVAHAVGTVAFVYGLAVIVLENDWRVGLSLVVVGWVIRRANRPGLRRPSS